MFLLVRLEWPMVIRAELFSPVQWLCSGIFNQMTPIARLSWSSVRSCGVVGWQLDDQ